jgi:acetoin utilization deacetylase AcuC-like enzyme
MLVNVCGCTRTSAQNRVDSAFALIRPPGHHASADRPCGFCFFNNVALGAKYAVEQLGMARVLIVDWDVHAGQGTQYCIQVCGTHSSLIGDNMMNRMIHVFYS